MKNYSLVPLSENHQNEFLEFTDRYIGKNYFNTTNFIRQIELSKLNGLNCSYILLDRKSKIIGIRLTYAPGKWQPYIKNINLKNVKVAPNKVAYFKSLFIDKHFQGQKLGPLLSSKSIETLIKMKATHVFSHSWLESPNNSSVKYLEKSGFKSLGVFPIFWSDCDYLCSGCNKKPCLCSAMEMIYKIKKAPTGSP